MGEDGAQKDADGAALVGLQPGTMQLLLPGEDIKFSDPADVGGSYESFQYRTMRPETRSSRLCPTTATANFCSSIPKQSSKVAQASFRRPSWPRRTRSAQPTPPGPTPASSKDCVASQRWQPRRSNPATLTARRHAQIGNGWIPASGLKCLATLRQDETDDSPAVTIPRSQCRSRNSAVRAPSTGTAAMNRWFAGSPQGSRSWRQDTSTLTACSASAAP